MKDPSVPPGPDGSPAGDVAQVDFSMSTDVELCFRREGDEVVLSESGLESSIEYRCQENEAWNLYWDLRTLLSTFPSARIFAEEIAEIADTALVLEGEGYGGRADNLRKIAARLQKFPGR